MTFNFEYIDIILMAMIAGFILLRLKNVLGRRTGNEKKPLRDIYNLDFGKKKESVEILDGKFDDRAKKHFILGAKKAYETIITSFAKGDKVTLKTLLSDKIYKEFSGSIDNRNSQNIKSETTFIGIKSAEIGNIIKEDNLYKITVKFVSEIITCLKNKDNKVIEGDPDTIKIVRDEWKFSKNMWSHNPTWYLIETINN